MEIRHYRRGDIPSMLEALEVFLAETESYKEFPLDKAKVTRLLTENLNNSFFFGQVGVVKDVVHAALVARAVPLVFSQAMVAVDLILFVLPGSRSLDVPIKLIEDYIEWSKARKVTRMLLGATTGIDVAGFDLLMARVGFRELGRVWARDME